MGDYTDMSVALKLGLYNKTSAQFLAVFMVTKHIFQAKTRFFPNLNQVVFVPKTDQRVKTEPIELQCIGGFTVLCCSGNYHA